MKVIVSLEPQNQHGDPVDHSNKRNPSHLQPEAQSLPLDQVAESDNSQDVELEIPSIWMKTSCCGKTFYVDPISKRLHLTGGDSSSGVHRHEIAGGHMVDVHDGEERPPVGLSQALRGHA